MSASQRPYAHIFERLVWHGGRELRQGCYFDNPSSGVLVILLAYNLIVGALVSWGGGMYSYGMGLSPLRLVEKPSVAV